MTMASIHKKPNGTRRLLFMANDGIRRSVQLGKISARLAEGYKGKIGTIDICLPTGWAFPRR